MLTKVIEFFSPKVVRDTTNDRLVDKVPKSTKPTYEIYKDKQGEWRWRITALNKNVIGASCEGYKKKVDAEKNLRYITSLRIGQ